MSGQEQQRRSTPERLPDPATAARGGPAWLRSPAAVVALAVAGVTLAACASGPPGPEDTRRHMFSGMWQMGSIPGRLAMDDLDGTRRPARWLRTRIDEEEMLGDAEVKARMVGLAARIEGADDVAEAAEAVAELAATCGDCHAEVGGGPDFGSMGSLPVGSRLATHMIRHVWASDRLWEGLFEAGTERWDAGAAVLAEDPIAYFSGLDDVPEAARHASRIHELADDALAAPDRAARAAVYADVLTTCAACHEAMEIPRG